MGEDGRNLLAARGLPLRLVPAESTRGPGPCAEAEGRELGQALDEQVNRLPARYREVFVPRCLAGKSGAEAARELGCPVGTVESWLARARERLRAALVRRGFTAPAGLLGVALAREALAPAPLVSATVKAAALFAAGQAASAGRVHDAGQLRLGGVGPRQGQQVAAEPAACATRGRHAR
jgi:hypothetical protein